MADKEPNLTENAAELANKAMALADDAAEFAVQAASQASLDNAAAHADGIIIAGLTVFVLACLFL